MNPTIAEEEGFEKLPISFYYGERVGDLLRHHRDPFDRMLTAQSQAEGLEFITAVNLIPRYAAQTVNALE